MVKKIHIKIVSFILVVIFLYVLLYQVYSYTVLSKNLNMRTDLQFQDYKNSTSILFLGDSHIQHAFSTKIISNSFNFASGGEPLILTYYKLTSYFDDDDFHPDVVVLPLDAHTLSSSIFAAHDYRDEWYWKKYINYLTLFSEHNLKQ